MGGGLRWCGEMSGGPSAHAAGSEPFLANAIKSCIARKNDNGHGLRVRPGTAAHGPSPLKILTLILSLCFPWILLASRDAITSYCHAEGPLLTGSEGG